MEDICDVKKSLRSRIRQEAKALPAEYLAASDAGIEQGLLELPAWQQAKTVFMYISTGTEPNTHGIFAEAVRQGKQVAVPRCLKDGIMECRVITGLNTLQPKSFGILEPDETAPLLEADAFDLVIAPCVATDERCNRLGNGGGYYDRFLEKVSCPVVCLCRERLVQKELPTEDYDLPVNMVLTEERIIRRLTLEDFNADFGELLS